MAKKYIKNNSGVVMSVTTEHLQLEKPLINEHYDIEVHNRNMDNIDNAMQDIKGNVDGLELTAKKVSIADTNELFNSTNVEDALSEIKLELDDLELVASNVKMKDGSTVEDAVTLNKVNILNLQEEINGARETLINYTNNIVALLGGE